VKYLNVDKLKRKKKIKIRGNNEKKNMIVIVSTTTSK
jgi:hypothetical protein